MRPTRGGGGSRTLRWRRSGRRNAAWLGVAALVAAVLSALAIVSSFASQSDAALVIMGFDPDRAALITGLLVAGGAAAVAALITARLAAGTIAGLVALIAMFAATFVQETRGALAATGADGTFDPSGWLLTLATLLASGLILGYAAAAVALTVRPALLAALAPVGRLLRGPDRRVSQLRRPALLVVALVALAVGTSTLGDLLNYAPDSLMRHGGPPPIPLAEGAGGGPLPGLGASPPVATTTPGAAASSGPSTGPSAGWSASPSPATTAPTARPIPRPWLAWRPSGSGRVLQYQLPAPWVGATPVNDVAVYLPPGYATDPNRRYPVLYEAPQPFWQWNGAISVKALLDTLIDGGDMPASIVVFVTDEWAGPYPDSECADSFDGREWMDRFIGETAVQWVDAHFRTIRSPAARAEFGMSQGGYCAAILTLHHPDVFGSAVAFSGYYQAGVAAPSAAAVFGGVPSLLAADSPLVVAPRLAAAVRARTAFVLIAERSQWFYGPQQAAFVNALTRAGYPVDPFWVSTAHGWQQVRAEFAAAFEAVAQHEMSLGVFG